MPSYTVTYFNSRGRAEVMRWILILTGQQFQDKRLTWDEWMQFKPDTPYGQIPLLEVDGKVFCQSYATTRYLARVHDLYGKDALEACEIDMIVDCVEDGLVPILEKYFFGPDDQQTKEEFKKKFEDELLPKSLRNLENFLIANGGEYFVGGKLSMADLCFSHYISYLDIDIKHNRQEYPKLFELRERVENLPKLKEWLASRPNCKF